MQTLKIEIPSGYEIDSFDPRSGEIKFKEKPKKVTDRIKTVTDLLADHGLTQDQFDEECLGLEEDEVAYQLIKMLAKSLNEGWIPDWDNRNELKYYPWFELGGSSGFRFDGCGHGSTLSCAGSRLCFKSRELAEHAGKHFTEVYKQFMVAK